jgi:hypothetical protein
MNAGFRNLDQACAATDERDSLLREARDCFNKAVGLERGLRQGLALLGCAVCHHHLRDAVNCRRCVDELVRLPPAAGVAVMTAAHSSSAAEFALGAMSKLTGGWSVWVVIPFIVFTAVWTPVMIFLGKLFGLWGNQNANPLAILLLIAVSFALVVGALVLVSFLIKSVWYLFVSAERAAERKRVVMDAVKLSADASSLLKLQQAVSQHTGTPVAWLAELEAGRL